MKLNLQRFPWSNFWKLFIIQFVSYNILFFLIISIIDQRYKVPGFVYNEAWLNYFFFSFFVTLGTTLYFCWPLVRILRDQASSQDYEGVDGWEELEGTLGRLQRNLEQKNIELLNEKNEIQSLLTSLTEALVTVDQSWKIKYSNLAFEKLFSFGADFETGKPVLPEFIRSTEFFNRLESVFETGQAAKFLAPIEVRGESRDFSIKLTPLFKTSATGVSATALEVLIVFFDITDIQAAQKQRTDFVANASHELRTPLTNIKGYVDTLHDDLIEGRSTDAVQFIGIIQRNVDRLIDIVNDLLSLNRLESTSDLKKDNVSTSQVTEHVLMELNTLIEEKHSQIFTEVDDLQFFADPIKVELVLKNLVLNAVKYAPEWSNVRILWRLEAEAIVLTVTDNGPGISEEHLPRLFERFYRVDKGRARDRGGTGLGLAIVKHIMQAHGGTVQVSSQVGSGSQFTCRFPMEN